MPTKKVTKKVTPKKKSSDKKLADIQKATIMAKKNFVTVIKETDRLLANAQRICDKEISKGMAIINKASGIQAKENDRINKIWNKADTLLANAEKAEANALGELDKRHLNKNEKKKHAK